MYWVCGKRKNRKKQIDAPLKQKIPGLNSTGRKCTSNGE
jgi:hypothetical protein